MEADGVTYPDMISTGIAGLDEILSGGLTKDRVYLIEGVPGSGKTTMALQFLLAGIAAGETVLYVTLSETRTELQAVGKSHGWDLTELPICEITAPEDSLDPDQEYSVFHPAEVELSSATQKILGEIDRLRPSRVVFDSLSELRLLASNPLRYRRQVLALKQYFIGRGCTVLLLDDYSGLDNDAQVQSVAHGVIMIGQERPAYGRERRRLGVLKFRGVAFRGGSHDFNIRKGGLVVFPRAAVGPRLHEQLGRVLSSGVPALDDILNGGLQGGTNTLITGAAGSGKSTIAATFALAAARRGDQAAMFVFDESRAVLVSRMTGLGTDFAERVSQGQIAVEQIDPAELSPGEFSDRVRTAANAGAALIVIDSLNGYLNAMPDERFLVVHLHELLAYLGSRNVVTILVGVHSGLIGANLTSAVDASYLADGIILLRYFEAQGEVRQAVSVMKKRGGAHERTLREFRITSQGIEVGDPLTQFRGVLTGTPVYDGADSELMRTMHG